MTRRVLWYVHDHGRGHLQRARAVLPHLAAPVVVAAGPGVAAAATATLPAPVVRLPADGATGRPVPRGPWHHAPAGALVRERMLALSRIVEAHDCATAVVDVSMEVTAFASLLGLRTVALRQSGRRDDDGHRVGLSCADVVWVPQHRALEPLACGVDDRWCFTGAFSRDDALPVVPPPTRTNVALLVLGAGGSSFDERPWRRAAAPPGWRVTIVGGPSRWCGDGVRALGPTEPLRPLLDAATVVVTGGGWAGVADVVAAGRPLVVVPEARPFDEQLVRARALAAAGLAVRLDAWPRPDELAAAATRARALDPSAWWRHYDHRGAERAAAMIDATHLGLPHAGA